MVRPEKIRMLAAGETAPGALGAVVREVSYLGAVTRYIVETDAGQSLVVLRQNLDRSAAEVLAERERRVQIAWRAEDASRLETNNQEEAN
jgi:ABC-type Fe3+/spermidine/putrescine transport system ATPase subunit